jgi:hypothetical protein
MRHAIRPLLLSLALLAPAVAAFTPESGLWGDRNNTGTALTFDLQDNLLQITAYTYRPDGAATWFVSAGPLTYTYNTQGRLVGVRYDGVFNAATGGSCVGCGPANPVVSPGAGGPVRIDFISEIRARMTWQGRTFDIDRFTLALGDPVDRMVGEWSLTIDFATRGNQSYPYADYPYFGDLLLVDRVDRTRVPAQFQGCRPERSTSGRCSATARANHDLAGFYDAQTGEHVIVVKDVPPRGSNPAVFFAYFAAAGTSQFDGVLEIYLSGQTPGNGPFYPVRGFRSASRTFVTTGVGPSAQPGEAPTDATTPAWRAGLSETLAARGVLPPGLTVDDVRERYGIDVARLVPAALRLTAELDGAADGND